MTPYARVSRDSAPALYAALPHASDDSLVAMRDGDRLVGYAWRERWIGGWLCAVRPGGPPVLRADTLDAARERLRGRSWR